MYKEFVIGFDCRVMWFPDEKLRTWPQPGKESFLKLDIERMLTISRLIWPSVFVTRNAQLDSMWVGTAPGYSLETPYQYRTIDSYWDDLERMLTFLKDNKEAYQKPSWAIAITVVQTPKYDELFHNPVNKYAFDSLKKPDCAWPSEVDQQWTLLGYDAQDLNPVFTEGLGGTYPGENQQDLIERWGEHLNQYHLFKGQEQAILFAEWLDKREPLIGPYFAYGLYLIQPFPEA